MKKTLLSLVLALTALIGNAAVGDVNFLIDLILQNM